MFYSQAGQDLWALQLTNKGFFVDIGAHDGIESSNTYALSQAGWGGVCIEPNPESFKRLQLKRGCICVNDAASELAPHDLVTILGKIQAPLVIDYISLDVEGAELDILRGMDFNKYHVRRITVEHNKYLEGTIRQQQIFEYMTSQGFVRTHKDVKCLDGVWYGMEYEDWYERNESPQEYHLGIIHKPYEER